MSFFLVYDGGGTATRAGLYTREGVFLDEACAGPCNPVDHGIDHCIALLCTLARRLVTAHPGPLEVIAGGISGAGQSGAAPEIARALFREWRPGRVVIASDVRACMFANAGPGAGILVVAGTGSCVLGQDAGGHAVTVGGRGAFFGDEGSAYQIAASALRAVAKASDGLGPGTSLAQTLREAVQGVGDEAGLFAWARCASKHDMAQLAPLVDALAGQGDAVAREILAAQARLLAEQVLAVRDGLSLPESAPLYMIGGVFEHSQRFRGAFETALREKAPGVRPAATVLRGHRAVLQLALASPPPEWAAVCAALPETRADLPLTEQSATRAQTLDRMTSGDIVRAMNMEDTEIAKAVAAQTPTIAAAMEVIAAVLRAGGRLIYIGAGTSGRLGVLDASECPPTFGVSPERVIALIAGGDRALRESVEGAEDDTEQAARDVQRVEPPISSGDVVVGITASGNTPYVRAALETAKGQGARTVLVCCNPAASIPADIVVALATGSELLPGSTRLKAGTATKRVLNTISTGAMALSGFVYEGLMVGVQPRNEKLRQRAIRIVASLTGLDLAAARDALEAAGYQVSVAVIMARKSVEATEAEGRLEGAGGSLRAALDRD